MPKLSDRIKELRKSAGMTQEEFGQKFGVVKSTVSLYESGKSTPNDELKQKICEYFNISLDYLHGMTNKKNGYLNESFGKTTSSEYSNSYTLGYWIEKTGYSISEIAKKLGITQDLLEDYMSETIAAPYNILLSLSNICEVSTDCLLGLHKESRPPDLDDILPFQYDYQISKRIKELCDKKNVSTDFLLDLLSLSKKEVYYLIEYGFVPHISTITKLANFFHVSCDYLLCQIENQNEKALMAFRLLNEDNKDIIIGEIKKALREQKYEETVAADIPPKKTGTESLGK